MPENDPATDNLNYAGVSLVGTADFDVMNYEDVEDDDLFWFSNSPNSDDNAAFRKQDEISAMNTKTRQIANNIDKYLRVYQKIWDGIYGS